MLVVAFVVRSWMVIECAFECPSQGLMADYFWEVPVLAELISPCRRIPRSLVTNRIDRIIDLSSHQSEKTLVCC